MTEFEKALRGEITPLLAGVARDEGIEPERLRKLVAEGRAVLTGAARPNCRRRRRLPRCHRPSTASVPGIV